MKIKLEGAAEADAMSMFVHAVEEKTAEEDPGRGGAERLPWPWPWMGEVSDDL